MTEERQLLRQTVATLIDKHSPPEAVRRAMDSERGYDEQLWAMLCEQVGVAALVVPEEFGGAGGELADAAAVLEELGRGLVPTPLLGTTLAEVALLASAETADGSNSAESPDPDMVEQLASGAAVGTVVFDPDYVLNGAIADVVLVAQDGRIARWTDADVEPTATMDPTRRLARLSAGTRTVIGTDPGIADTAAILLAAEQIGAASRCLDLTVEYTKQRVQFGRPIGSFQALKHRMADLYVAVESARAVVGEAVANPTAVSAALARLAASEAFSTVAAEAIQLHGGIAITWEHDMHLYFKRAHGSAHLLGGPREQLHQLESQVC